MKKIKKFDFAKKPKRCLFIFHPILRMLSEPDLKKHGFVLNKINMEGLKPPYLLLSNHQSPLDLKIGQMAVWPYLNHPVTALDGFKDYTEFLLRGIGSIGKRKFTSDLNLIKNIKYCIDKLKEIVIMYPEARYSLDGTTSYLPPALGKLIKLLKVPVVTLMCCGPMISFPQWNKERKDAPLKATMTRIVTQEETETLSHDEINERIKQNFVYDDFKYQKDNNIVIDHPNRAEGLHSILYQCPHCKTEHKMYSKNTKLWCNECGKVWTMTELGELKADEGETEFSHIPDWFDWEYENVKREVLDGTYHFEDEVRVKTLPNAQRFYEHPNGKLIHTLDGFRFYGEAYGKKYDITIDAAKMDSVHIEYDFKKEGDALDISVPDESYWLYPNTRRDVITKIAFATEEIHKLKLQKNKQKV